MFVSATMETISRRYNKLNLVKKDAKTSKKPPKSRKKSENEDFFAGFKKKKHGLLATRGVQKITTSRLTVRTKTLNNAVRSVIAVKERIFNLGEASKAGINEDLFKVIDLNYTEQTKNDTCAIIQSPTSFNPINEPIISNKSIFREIEEKFAIFNPSPKPKTEPYLISDDSLQELISRKLEEKNNLILNPWATTIKSFLFHIGSADYIEVLTCKIVNNQSTINENCTLFELKTKFKGVPLASTCLRRKFTRRVNELINLQNLGANLIMSSQADDKISRAEIFEDDFSHNFELKLKLPQTPPKGPQKAQEYPKLTYKTPENQKFNIHEFASTSTKIRMGLKDLNDQKYLVLDRETCEDPSFAPKFGFSRAEHEFCLQEGLKNEMLDSLDLNSVLNRPKKLQTVRKFDKSFLEDESSSNGPFGAESPNVMAPHRKLNFSESFSDENFDLCLLTDVGAKNPSPVRFRGLFTENGARKSDKNTPKRGLEAMLSPSELKLWKKSHLEEQENIYSRAKKFAAAPEALGPMPKGPDTPNFKFHPRIYPKH